MRNNEIEKEIEDFKSKNKESDHKTLELDPTRMQAWKKQEDLFASIGKDNEKMNTLDCYQRLIKTYTLETCYLEINNKLKNGEFTDLIAYFSSIFEAH